MGNRNSAGCCVGMVTVVAGNSSGSSSKEGIVGNCYREAEMRRTISAYDTTIAFLLSCSRLHHVAAWTCKRRCGRSCAF